jgi:hypothetical protein
VYDDLPTNDELLMEINTKLTLLVEGMFEGRPRHPDRRSHAHASENERHPEPLVDPLDERQTRVSSSAPQRQSAHDYGSGANQALQPVDALEELTKLLALNLKRKRDFEEVVAELDAVGFDRVRIGELLGASPSKVDAALATYDRHARKKRR